MSLSSGGWAAGAADGENRAEAATATAAARRRRRVHLISEDLRRIDVVVHMVVVPCQIPEYPKRLTWGASQKIGAWSLTREVRASGTGSRRRGGGHRRTTVRQRRVRALSGSGRHAPGTQNCSRRARISDGPAVRAS
ncbi:hypothetical protein GCM10022206_63000 [Streptomyces chiangmaiensis]